MSDKNIALGFAIGLGIGAVVGLLCTPRTGENNREFIKNKSAVALKKLKSSLRWSLMTPRERYIYLWNRGGSLRNWECRLKAKNPD